MTGRPIQRMLEPPGRSFFLFGPRGAGKSTWLRSNFSNVPYFDLLDFSLQMELSQDLTRLEALVGKAKPNQWVVIDEIQKLAALLDEVHRLMELRRWRFALCGSSARKLRRGGVNLLGGRAVTRYLESFSLQEIGNKFRLDQLLEWGTMPFVVLDPRSAADILQSYVETYIQQEIKEEGIVRQLPPFLRFLRISGQLNAAVVNLQNISRETAVPRSTAETYFSILEDTHLGHFLPAYRPNVKVREQTHPKFYWFDCGVARAAAGLLFDPVDRAWKGNALETLVFHELRIYNHLRQKNRTLGYYRSPAGVEIDFVIEIAKRTQSSPARLICIETKLSDRWNRRWEYGMRSLHTPGKLLVDQMIGVYCGKRVYHFDGVDVLPFDVFVRRLYQNEIF